MVNIQQIETVEDTSLLDYRVRRLKTLEDDIERRLAVAATAIDTLENEDIAIADDLANVEQERLYELGKHTNMREYGLKRWPDFKKTRFYQLLSFGRINACIDRYNQDNESTETEIRGLPRLKNEFQARAVDAIKEEGERIPTYQLAVEKSGGKAPSGRKITAAHQEITAGRIGRLDTNKNVVHVEREPFKSILEKDVTKWAHPVVQTDHTTRYVTMHFPGGFHGTSASIAFERLIEEGWTPPPAPTE